MELILSIVSLFTFLALFLGLIKPQWVKMPSRKRSSAIYGFAFLFAAILGSTLYPTEQQSTTAKFESAVEKPVKFEYADLALAEYRRKPQEERHEIVNDYVQFKGIQADDNEGFYACLSQYSLTKSGELSLGEVLGWCDTGYQKDPKSIVEFINFDAYQGNFSGWDGSYRPLEKLIKKSMNDDSSYKHVETVSHLILDQDPHGVVKTKFKGANAFGGIVTQTVTARVDLKTGDVESIIED